MDNISISKVHLKDEESLLMYYNECGLSPALKLSDSAELDYKKITYSLDGMFICSTASSSGWGFEKQQETDVFFVTFTHQGESIWEMNKQGRIRASQQLCIVDSSRLVQGQFTRGTYTETIMIDAKLLVRELEITEGICCSDRLEFQPVLDNDRRVWPMLNSIIGSIKAGMDFHQALHSPLAVGYMKQALISTLLECIPHNYSSTHRIKSPAPAPRYISRAIEYMHSHAGENITIGEVAIYACTSVRNLQLGFRSYKQVSPIQYLRSIRLASAHSDLLDENVCINWQQIAIRWGFADIGLFSRYYKDRYGKTPFQAQLRSKKG